MQYHARWRSKKKNQVTPLLTPFRRAKPRIARPRRGTAKSVWLQSVENHLPSIENTPKSRAPVEKHVCNPLKGKKPFPHGTGAVINDGGNRAYYSPLDRRRADAGV
jgi:hypothetical protein